MRASGRSVVFNTEKDMTDKKYFGFVSYFAALLLISATVWFWVDIWILAVIPHIVFGAFFLSVFVDTGYMYLRRNMTALRFRNAVVYNFSALLATGVVLSILYVVLS